MIQIINYFFAQTFNGYVGKWAFTLPIFIENKQIIFLGVVNFNTHLQLSGVNDSSINSEFSMPDHLIIYFNEIIKIMVIINFFYKNRPI